MRELHHDELELVAGTWGLPGAGTGALAGAAGYLGEAAVTGDFSWGGLWTATVIGAGLGAIAGPVGAFEAYLLPRAAFGGGLISGYVDNCGW